MTSKSELKNRKVVQKASRILSHEDNAAVDACIWTALSGFYAAHVLTSGESASISVVVIFLAGCSIVSWASDRKWQKRTFQKRLNEELSLDSR